MLQVQPQPFSVALQQLEAAVTGQVRRRLAGHSCVCRLPTLQRQPASLARRRCPVPRQPGRWHTSTTRPVQVLPAKDLEANRQAMAAVTEFARSLENADTPTGYPAASIRNLSFTFRRASTREGCTLAGRMHALPAEVAVPHQAPMSVEPTVLQPPAPACHKSPCPLHSSLPPRALPSLCAAGTRRTAAA